MNAPPSKLSFGVSVAAAVLMGIAFVTSRSVSTAQPASTGSVAFPLVSLWEYQFVAADEIPTKEKALERFNALGRDGWEFTAFGTPAKDQRVVAVFKRRLTQP